METFELCIEGHATGLACALASRIECVLPFAAFKMAHPLEVKASVILEADDASAARSACAKACEDIATDVRGLLAQLPSDPHAKEKAWPERTVGAMKVALRPRRVHDET